VVLPPLVIGFIPLFYIYSRIAVVYRACSRELKRLDSISLSPVFQLFTESMDGAATIRAFGSSERMLQITIDRLEYNTQAWLKNNLVNRWMGVRLDWIGVGLVSVTAAACVIVVDLNTTVGGVTVDSGIVGLILSYAVVVTGQLNWGVRNVSDVEQQMTGVQRIANMAETEPESWDPIEGKAVQVPDHWPTTGVLEVKELSLRYRPGLPLVLDSVSFGPVAPGNRVGVCGRTGSGKSTLALALFRMVEPASGAILLDGIDTQGVPLATLRNNLAMVPQDPTLFGGTVRYNIDPTGIHSDADISNAIAAVGMDAWVDRSGGLTADIADGGTDLSAGQRQLLCLARVLLKQPRVLCMDEATSSLDHATDERIQTLLRKRDGPLGAATIIAIAHRLETIVDYDEICVLDKGKVAEFGPPKELLQRSGGHFWSMVHDATKDE